MSRKDYRLPLALQFFLWVIPINIYVIGDWMGSGIQWLVVRYQQTNIGNSLIFLNREIGFVLHGELTGKSAIASVVLVVGVTLICFATLIMIYAYYREKQQLVKKSAVLNAGGAVLLTLSIIIQYGITLHGPAGFTIPIGILVIFMVAYFQYHGEPPTKNEK
jgi:hypothetical protein